MYISPAGEFRFEWDPVRAASDARKYGVSFDSAQGVFFDEYALQLDDLGTEDGDRRFVMLGMGNTLELLVVVYAYRDTDRVIRLLSARKATRTEHEQYTAHLWP